jgi:anaerobic dimethyl sulfoxide reductase subunit A
VTRKGLDDGSGRGAPGAAGPEAGPDPDPENGSRLDRRDFLKLGAVAGGVAAAGTLGVGLALPGAPRLPWDLTDAGAPGSACGPLTGGEWVPAPCWHNCGGQRCLLLAYVVDGSVRAVKSDDTHPDSPARPQMRACARGRAQEGQVFGPDRLRYPMKRRGWAPGGGARDLRGEDAWERISWDEALDLTATELARILGEYGNESVLELGGTLRRLFTALGGSVTNWGSTSWGTWYHTGPMIGLGDGLGSTSHNDRLDLQNCELIVLWGGNPAWSAQGNAMHYYLEARRAGAKFIFIDPYYNDSAMTLADEWVPVRPGTDHALALGMACTLLEEDDPATNPLIDWDFLHRCTVGFDAEHMPPGADPADTVRDYILGRRDGTPKTAEWAARICGVSAPRIRRLARQIARTRRTALLTAWAPARTHDSDAWPQMFLTLGCMTGHIGEPGRMTGVSCWERTADGGPFLVGAGGAGTPRLRDTPPQTGARVNNSELWDAVLAGEYTASGGERRPIDVRAIVHDGASALNQTSGLLRGIEAHRHVEFVLTLNFVYNTNARYSDVVLPVTTQWERHGYFKGNRDHLIWARQVVPPQYEARDDAWIAAELGRRLGLDPTNIAPLSPAQETFNRLAGAWVLGPGGRSRERLVTITHEDIRDMGVEGQPQEGRISLAEFREKGIYVVPRRDGDGLGHVAFQDFRRDPEAHPLSTRSGRFELHCQRIADHVASVGFSRIDPIPTYRPPAEGYEETFEDFERGVKGRYPLQLITLHYRRRTHSVFDNVPWLREAFPQEFIMNPVDAEARGVVTGDVVRIRSRHGAVLRPVFVTERLMPGVVALGEGAWVDVDVGTGLDRAGATNMLNGARPTGQGHQGWNTCVVEVTRYRGQVRLKPDWRQPPRLPEGAV